MHYFLRKTDTKSKILELSNGNKFIIGKNLRIIGKLLYLLSIHCTRGSICHKLFLMLMMSNDVLSNSDVKIIATMWSKSEMRF